jgi:hypothetical protein
LLIRGDLDWIVMKTLEKDRARRYDTAAGLAADVQRYLDNAPVEARSPSASYRLFKFVSRHRGLITGATAAVTLLMVAAVVSILLATIARKERDIAAVARERAFKQAEIAQSAWSRPEAAVLGLARHGFGT